MPSADTRMSQVLSRLRSLTSSLFGVAAGVLGLEAYIGFLFYLVGTSLVSGLIWALLAQGRPGRYFGNGPPSLTSFSSLNDSSALSSSAAPGFGRGKDSSEQGDAHDDREEEEEDDVSDGANWRLWTEDVVTGLSSFVLTWTLFYGLVRV